MTLPTSFLFFNIVLAILGSLQLHINFRISLTIYNKLASTSFLINISLVVFIIFIELYSHHHYLILGLFQHRPKKLVPISSPFPFPVSLSTFPFPDPAPFQLQATINLLSVMALSLWICLFWMFWINEIMISSLLEALTLIQTDDCICLQFSLFLFWFLVIQWFGHTRLVTLIGHEILFRTKLCIWHTWTNVYFGVFIMPTGKISCEIA